MTPSPIIVCGLPRCGSSLMMQMLSAAGIRCAGEHPAYEPQEALKPRSEAYVEAWRDGAFKMLDPHSNPLPTGFKYRFIFLTRSRRQQTLSQMKFLRLMGVIKGSIDDEEIKRHEDSLRVDEALAFESIRVHECSVLKISFEDLISRTPPTVNKIAWFLSIENDATEDAMRRCVRPRAATCYPGMLELELMKEMEAASAPFDALLCTCHIPPYIVPCDYCKTHNPNTAES